MRSKGSTRLESAGRAEARRMVAAQLVATLLMGTALLPVGKVHAYSALIGGGVATLTNAYLMKRIFVRYRAQQPERLVLRIYGAELSKLILTGLMFLGAILWIEPLSIVILFLAYLVTQMVPWLVASIAR